MTRRECQVYSKGNCNSSDEIKENNNHNKNSYYFYKDLFKKNGKLDDMFDFE